MKERFKKLTALLAAGTMLVGVLTGCGDTTQVQGTETGTTNSTESEVTAQTSETQSVEEEFSYPMDAATITYSVVLPGAVKANADNMGDTEYSKEMEKATGIHVEFNHDNGNTSEWFNLMLADNELTDVIEYGWAHNYPGGLAGAYNDDVIIALNDVIDQYMPNFKAFLAANPDIDKMIKTDDGMYYGIPAVTSDARMGNTFGYYVRQDWLEELEIEMPTTIDEWHDALVKIKDEKGVTPITFNGSNPIISGAFLNAYAPSIWNSRYSIDAETGEVVYTAATEGYKEFLTTFAQWYKEGLIDKDIASLDSATVKAKMLTDEAAIAWGYAGSGLQKTMQEAQATNPDFVLAAIPGVASEEGAEILYSSANLRVSGTYAVITTQCENVEAAARYLDFLYSEEGIMISNFGVEGVSYTMVDGVPTYTDEILKNAEGKSVTEAMGKYIRAMSSFAGIQDYNYLIGYYDLPTVKEAPGAWGAYGTANYELGSLSFTAEENEKLAAVSTEINTTADEMAMKFILGTADIEKEWDEYVATLEKFGLTETIEVYQTAYERYQSR